MADAYLETTKWSGNTPNHTYLIEGDKAIAYIKFSSNEPAFYFSQPWRIDKRGRTFKKLDVNPFGQPKVESNLIEVAGSKGNMYYVDPIEKTCSCPGFIFRGKCRHLDQLK